jgi:hypothetical protein
VRNPMQLIPKSSYFLAALRPSGCVVAATGHGKYTGRCLTGYQGIIGYLGRQAARPQFRQSVANMDCCVLGALLLPRSESRTPAGFLFPADLWDPATHRVSLQASLTIYAYNLGYPHAARGLKEFSKHAFIETRRVHRANRGGGCRKSHVGADDCRGVGMGIARPPAVSRVQKSPSRGIPLTGKV